MADHLRIDYLYQFAASQSRSGQTFLARETLTTVLTLAPGHVAARCDLAAIFHSEGRSDMAILHLALAYQIDPKWPGLAGKLGEQFFLNGLYREAIPHLENAIKMGDQGGQLTEKLILAREMVNSQQPRDPQDSH